MSKRIRTMSNRMGSALKYDTRLAENSEYKAHIIQSKFKDGSYVLRYILHTPEGHPAPGAQYHELTLHGDIELEQAKQMLIHRLSQDIPKAKPDRRSSKTRGHDRPGRFAEAFAVIANSPDLFPRWGESTFHSAVTWAERNFLPVLNNVFSGEDTAVIGGPLLQQWKEVQWQKTMRNGRSHGNVTVNATTNRHLRECAEIYEQMRRIDQSLPRLDGEAMYPRTRTIEVEQFKAIPEECRQQLYRRLEDISQTDPANESEALLLKYCFAATIMISGMTRTAEAAAVRPCDVFFSDDYAVIPIICQEKGGKRSPMLKTVNGYRNAIVSRWGKTVLKDCADNLHDYIPHGDDEALVSSHHLSAWILGLMCECGVDAALIKAAEAAEALFPDNTPSGIVSHDLAAYIFRRDCASRMQDYCGMGEDEINQIIGHSPSASGGKIMNDSLDMTLLKSAAEISAKEERYVYSTNPRYTRNPGYRPISMVADMDLHMIPYPRYLFESPSDAEGISEVSIDIEACEPGEEITITIFPVPNAIASDGNITSRSIYAPPSNRLIIHSNMQEVKHAKN